MRPEDARALLDRRPFRPFQIHMDDGTSFDIRHPEQVLVTRSELIIGLAETNGQKVYDRTVFAALLHVTRLESQREAVE